MDAEEQQLAEQQLERQLRAEKLATVEDLLWNTCFLQQDSESPAKTGKLTLPSSDFIALLITLFI